MRNLLALLALVVLLAPDSTAAQTAAKADDAALLAEIEKIRQPGMMNVPRADGEFLHEMILERGYKRVLEIGTSNGYSGAWMGWALKKAGGKLITLELDERRASLAAENFKRLGFDTVIELRRGDALKLLPAIEGPFDLVFIDAWKPDYLEYLRQVLPKVRSGGAIVAHNISSHAEELGAFVETVMKHPQLDSRIDRRSSAGMTVSIKK